MLLAMKRFIYLRLLVALPMAALLWSCNRTDPTGFDSTLLHTNGGKWSAPSASNPDSTRYLVYMSDGWGKEWDTGDDVHESDLQQYGNGWFKWSVQGATLTHINYMDNGGAQVPKAYTITTLSAATFAYKDSRATYTYTKVAPGGK